MFDFIKQARESLSRQEKIFLLWSIAVIIFLTSASLFYAEAIAGERYFTGVSVWAGADKSVYLSQIEQARQGRPLFDNLYTAEAQKPRIFSPLWLVLGWLGKLTSISNFWIFHIARILSGIVFLYLFYLFLTRIFEKIKYRQLVFWILGLASGWGIFTVKRFFTEEIAFNQYGVDLWVSESNTFLTLAHSALFIISQGLILLIFWWLIERFKRANFKEVVSVSVIILLLGFLHPYDLVIIDSVLGVWLIWEMIREKKWLWRFVFKAMIIGLASLVPVLYFVWLFKSQPAVGGWAIQNITISPNILNYFIGYGLLAVGVLAALPREIKSQNNYWRFLSLWIIIGWLLLFAPFSFQRRLVNGLHLPMVILGFSGLLIILGWLKEIWPSLVKKIFGQSVLWVLAIFLLTITTFYNLFFEITIFNYRSAPQFISKSVYEAMFWLKDNVAKDQVILAEPINGNIIPALSANPVYIGHGHQTIDWTFKLYDVKNWFFLTNQGDIAKKAWLNQAGIDYVFFSSRERALGKFQPSEKDYLKQVYNQGGVEIYIVR